MGLLEGLHEFTRRYNDESISNQVNKSQYAHLTLLMGHMYQNETVDILWNS